MMNLPGSSGSVPPTSRRRRHLGVVVALVPSATALCGRAVAAADSGAGAIHLGSLPQLDALRRALRNHSEVQNVTRRVRNVDVINASALSGIEYNGGNYSDEWFHRGGARANELEGLFGDGEHDEIALCHLPHLFPFSFGAYSEASVVALAAHHLNTGNGSVVPDVKGLNERCNIRFTFELLNTGWSPKKGVDRVIDVTSRDAASSPTSDKPLPCALLGMASSSMSLPSAIVSGLRGFPQVSFQATSSALNNAEQYSLFGRTVPADEGTAIPLVLYYRLVLGVRYLAVLHVDGSYGNAYAEGVRDAAKVHASDMSVFLVSHSNKMNETVARLADTGCTYFFAIIWPNQVIPYMKVAYEHGIAGTGQHNWMFSDSIGGKISEFRKLALDSAAHLALLGSSVIGAVGGAPGMNMSSYNTLDASVRGLTQGDADYLRSKVPIAKEFNNKKQFTRPIGVWRPMLYDSVIALGLAACKATSDKGVGEYFTGKELFGAMVNSIFGGASGRVAFHNKTGSRVPCSGRFLIFNNIQDPAQTTHNTTKFKQVKASLFEEGEWREINPYVFNDNTTNIPPDLPPITVKENNLSTGLRAGGLTMCALIFLQAVAFASWTHRNRWSRVVTASQPIFLHIITLGVLIMGSTIIPLSIDRSLASKRGCDIACAAFPWLLFLGFNISFSALFTKTHRINLIFSNPRFKRITVTAKDVMVPMVAMLAANILILSLWTGLSPLHWETEIVRADRHQRTLEISGQCRTENPIPYVVTLLVFNFGTLLYSMQQAHRARKISTEFAESEYIFRAMTSMFLVSFIGVPVLIIANDNREAFFFVLSAIIFVCCTALLFLIFVPKMIIHRKRKKERKEKEAKKKAAQSHVISGNSGLTNMTDDLSLSSRHEMGIKIIDHPNVQEELREENERLKEELSNCKSNPAPLFSLAAPKQMVCPHCSVSFQRTDVFEEECSTSPLIPVLFEKKTEDDILGRESREQESADSVLAIDLPSTKSADVENGGEDGLNEPEKQESVRSR